MITEQQFCLEINVEPRTLKVWVREGWLLPRREEATLNFSEIDVARARLIRSLSEELGVNDEGIGVILDLLDQLHGARSLLKTVLGPTTVRQDVGPLR